MAVMTALQNVTLVSWASPAAQTSLSSSQLMLILVIAGVAVMVAVTARRLRVRDANSPRAYVREQVAQLREEAAVKTEVDALLVEVQNTARALNAQLDTNFRKLDRAVRDADDRIKRLEGLLRQAAGATGCDVSLGGETPAETESGPGDAPAITSIRYAKVYELAHAGRSPVEIARQTGRTEAEIELILALRRGGGGAAIAMGGPGVLDER